jgi:uncharacterized caspase-like protein
MGRVLLLIVTLIATLSGRVKEALLIGNYDYKYTTSLNKKVIYKLDKLKSVLESLGFNVVIKKNLSEIEFKEAIKNLAKRLREDRDNIGFLYYSGHGFQLNNIGYLLPVDVDSRNEAEVEYHTYI